MNNEKSDKLCKATASDPNPELNDVEANNVSCVDIYETMQMLSNILGLKFVI